MSHRPSNPPNTTPPDTTSTAAGPKHFGPAAPPLVLDPTFAAAKQLYAEMFGDALVTNTYLKLAVAALSLLVLFLAYTQLRVAGTIASFKPLVIRIDQVGRAESVRYGDMTYTPLEPEIKYFLSQFCRLYYSRNRATLKGNFDQALFLLEPGLAQQVRLAWAKSDTIEEFLRRPGGEVDIDVRNVVIEDLRPRPIRARVDFDQVLVNTVDRAEVRRIRYTANFAFRYRTDTLTADILAVNPLGMAIEYFREDLTIKQES